MIELTHISKNFASGGRTVYAVQDVSLSIGKGEIFGMAIMEAVYYCTSVAAYRAIGPSVTLKATVIRSTPSASNSAFAALVLARTGLFL